MLKTRILNNKCESVLIDSKCCICYNENKGGRARGGGRKEGGSSCAHFVCQKLCGLEGAKEGSYRGSFLKLARSSCPPFRTRLPLPPPPPPPPRSPRGLLAGTTCFRPRPSVPASSHLQRAWRKRIRGGSMGGAWEENGKGIVYAYKQRMSINIDIYTRHLHATYKHATGALPPL